MRREVNPMVVFWILIAVYIAVSIPCTAGICQLKKGLPETAFSFFPMFFMLIFTQYLLIMQDIQNRRKPRQLTLGF